MKKIYFIISLLVMLSCTNENDLDFTQLSITNNPQTRVVSTTSAVFDWEEISRITLFGNYPVTLPWYSGASATIPQCIKNDYKASDGWKLLYNYCTDPQVMENGKFYLIFYNIFSGRLRGFFYNVNNITGSQTTYWLLHFSEKSPILNDIDLDTKPLDYTPQETYIYTTNITQNIAKAVGYGWNSFEFDLLIYDPNIGDKNLTIDISAYDSNESTLDITGSLDLNSEGTIITSASKSLVDKTNNSTNVKFQIGDNVEQYYKEYNTNAVTMANPINNANLYHPSIYTLEKGLVYTDTLPQTRGILSNIGKAASLIKSGYNFLSKKFGGKKSETVEIAKSDVKITTSGKIQLQGTLKSIQQSNIYPISNLLIPGAQPAPNNTVLPAYSNPVGVWSLSATPTIAQSAKSIKRFLPKGRAGSGYKGYEYWEIPFGYDTSTFKVNFNPTLLPYIDKYEVQVDLIGKDDNNIYNNLSPNEVLFGQQICQSGTTSIVQSVSTSFTSSNKRFLFYRTCDRVLKTVSLKEMGGYNNVETYNGTFPSHITFEFKVTVTIYPKAPYDTTPVVTTRTFPCNKSSTKLPIL